MKYRYIIFLFISAISSYIELKANVISLVELSDSITIDGHTINIRASVEVDTIRSVPSNSSKWFADLEYISAVRMGTEISGNEVLPDGVYKVKPDSHLPEFTIEFTHPLENYSQLHLRGAVSLGLANYFDESLLETNVIGFDWEQDPIVEILNIMDPLQNETDTVLAPIHNVAKLGLGIGAEWHGVMRGARGWVWGAQIEWVPIKTTTALLYKAPLDPLDWNNVQATSTYRYTSGDDNSLRVRGFTSWSPWNLSWFLRAEMSWAPSKTYAFITLGYRWD